MKFYPYEKGGGGTKKVLVMLKGGHKRFPLFKRGGREKFKPVLSGGGRKRFRTRDFPIL